MELNISRALFSVGSAKEMRESLKTLLNAAIWQRQGSRHKDKQKKYFQKV